MKSLRELYRIGRGPSSSHTMAPARAAEMFRLKAPDAARYEVTLCGSLAATGKGHFTDRAVAAVLGEHTSILWKPETLLPFHPNGMIFRALDGNGAETAVWTVYSVGGGALSEGTGSAEGPEVYPFRDMAGIMDYFRSEGITLWLLAERFEGEEIWTYLQTVQTQM